MDRTIGSCRRRRGLCRGRDRKARRARRRVDGCIHPRAATFASQFDGPAHACGNGHPRRHRRRAARRRRPRQTAATTGVGRRRPPRRRPECRRLPATRGHSRACPPPRSPPPSPTGRPSARRPPAPPPGLGGRRRRERDERQDRRDAGVGFCWRRGQGHLSSPSSASSAVSVGTTRNTGKVRGGIDIRASDACTSSRQYGQALKTAFTSPNPSSSSDEKLSSSGMSYASSNVPRISACSSSSSSALRTSSVKAASIRRDRSSVGLLDDLCLPRCRDLDRFCDLGRLHRGAAVRLAEPHALDLDDRDDPLQVNHLASLTPVLRHSLSDGGHAVPVGGPSGLREQMHGLHRCNLWHPGAQWPIS